MMLAGGRCRQGAGLRQRGRGHTCGTCDRILPVLLALLLVASGAAAQAPFRVTEGERMRVVTRALGWTVLRDVAAPPGAVETGMVLIRAQRPVPPAARPGHLARTLRSLRPFRVTDLPAEDHLRLAGLPGDVIQARAIGQPSGCRWCCAPSASTPPTAAGCWSPPLPRANGRRWRRNVAAVLDGFRPG